MELQNTDERTLIELAKNSTTIEDLESVWRKAWSFPVRQALADNPNTPDYILDELDGNREIRVSVAKNHNTSKEKLDLLSRSPDMTVRAAVAKNQNISEKTRARLLNDKMFIVRRNAESNNQKEEQMA